MPEEDNAMQPATHENSNETAEFANDIPEIIGAATGVGAGGAIGFATLYHAGITGLSASGITSGLAAAGSLIGGGMVAGIAVIATPAVVLGIAGYACLSHINRGKHAERTDKLLQQTRQKQNTISEMVDNDGS